MSRETAPPSKSQTDVAPTAGEPSTEPGVADAAGRFTSAGTVPPVASGTAQAHPPTASELAFGPPVQLDPNAPAKPVAPLPLTDPKDLEARAARMEADRLLNSKDLETSDRAMQAVQLLLDLPADERAKAIDGLDAKAFANLLDRVPEDQRERFSALVDASQDPKRKLALWAAFHKSRAKNDLRRYEGDFGDEDRSDAQQAKLDKFERRKRGVEGDAAEVDDEVARLQAKDKQGALTVADVDAMRARKDLELDVEMKHNVNLTAEKKPRSDGSQVAWSTDELHGFDHALGKLPDAQAHGANSVETFQRRANPFMVTKGGEYLTDHVDVYDNAHHQGPPNSNSGDTFGHTVTHEIGHDVAHDHPAAFEKFKAASNWKTVDEKGLEHEHVSEDQRDQLDRRRRSAENADEQEQDVVANGKIFQPGDKKGEYLEVDATAMPATSEWRYAKTNAGEQFAEMYAKAVDEPEQIYRDFIAEPTKQATEARARVEQLRAEVAAGGDKLADKRAELAAAERAAATAEHVQKQRASELGIIREDVFHTQKAVSAASARLRAQHVSQDKIATFEHDAARAMTPVQVAELEQKAKG